MYVLLTEHVLSIRLEIHHETHLHTQESVIFAHTGK